MHATQPQTSDSHSINATSSKLLNDTSDFTVSQKMQGASQPQNAYVDELMTELQQQPRDATKEGAKHAGRDLHPDKTKVTQQSKPQAQTATRAYSNQGHEH